MPEPLILALDLGTTAAKVSLFDRRGGCVAFLRAPLRLAALSGGGFEQDAEEFVAVSRRLLARVSRELSRTFKAFRVEAAGVACQRSTIVVWERATGRSVGPAVSWLDRRAGPQVARLAPHAEVVARRTGLRLSAHYGAAHLARRLAEEPALARAARRGEVVAGPVASYVLSRIGVNAPPACDPTLAQRTMLFDPWRGRWDPWLCQLFRVPAACLPGVAPSAGCWGELDLGGRRVRVTALAGDQQAAASAFGLDAAARPALVHFGTGAFALWPRQPRRRRVPGLLHSVRADREGSFYIEGTVNAAGKALDAVAGWIGRARLRRILDDGRDDGGDYGDDGGEDGGWEPLPPEAPLLVPAFAGLGAPHWDDGARPVVFLAGPAGDPQGAGRPGRRRDVDPLRGPRQAAPIGGAREAGLAGGPEALVLAALSGIAHRVTDILEAGASTLPPGSPIIASGPLARLPWLVRLLADLTGRPVRVASEPEATLLGIARIAARAGGAFSIPAASSGQPVRPRLSVAARGERRRQWDRALQASRVR